MSATGGRGGTLAGDALTDRIVIFATGGTIASVNDPAAGGLRPARTGAELLAAVPEAAAEVQVVELANSSSTYFTPAQVFGWVKAVAGHLEDPAVAGAVITHGTDTIEESAYLFDLVTDGGKPVVFTGA